MNLKLKNIKKVASTLSTQENNTTGTPTEPGFKLTLSSNKEYDLDDIIFKKRRDNENCPLILKVNTENKNDMAVIKLITQTILEDYGIQNVTDENYKTLINEVPDFYTVFNLYFNRYYTYYYNELYNKVQNGSISLDTALELIITQRDYYKDLLEDASRTKAYSNVTNTPKIEFEYGTSPDYYDGDVINRLNVASDIEEIFAEEDQNDPNDRLVLKNSQGEIIKDQTPVYFKRINNESIFGKGNLNFSTFEDYLELLTHCFVITSDNYVVQTADGEFLDLNED